MTVQPARWVDMIPPPDDTLTITVRIGGALTTPYELVAAVRDAMYDYAGHGHETTPFHQLPGNQQGLIHDEQGNVCGSWTHTI